MALVVNTNVTSLKINNNLNRTTDRAATAMERMSTGYKINRAADDAAGLMIAKGLQTQVSGSKVAADNAQNATSILTTAEGVLDTIQNNLLRMRDLTLQAMNGGYSVAEVQALEAEAQARAQEIDRQSLAATFNQFKIFDDTRGASEEFVIQVGTKADKATNTISITDVFYSATLSSLTSDVLSGASGTTNFLSFTNGDDPATATVKSYDDMGIVLNALDSAVSQISTRRGLIGSTTNRLNSAVEAMTVQEENLSAAHSRIMDADIARESSEYTKQYILQQASASLLTQANQTPSLALSLI